jgi:Contractile injection system tube protein/LysM domain
MAIEKAYIALLKPTGNNGGGGAEDKRVTFSYNPKEFAYTKTASWERKAARGAKKAPPLEFKGTQPTSYTLEVFLDGYEKGRDVSKDIDTLTSCCVPMSETISSKKPSPPYVLFGWGSKAPIKAYVKSVAVKETMFNQSGVALRAICTVTMEEIAAETPKQNPTSGAKTAMRSHQVIDGDTLPSIAYKEYGQADVWRTLAEANGLDDPLRLPVGSRLLVPEFDEAS